MEDLLGRYLSDAEKILTAQEACFEVIETAPPNIRETENPGTDGFLRVIRQEYKNGVCVLTVCRIPDVYR